MASEGSGNGGQQRGDVSRQNHGCEWNPGCSQNADQGEGVGNTDYKDAGEGEGEGEDWY